MTFSPLQHIIQKHLSTIYFMQLAEQNGDLSDVGFQHTL